MKKIKPNKKLTFKLGVLGLSVYQIAQILDTELPSVWVNHKKWLSEYIRGKKVGNMKVAKSLWLACRGNFVEEENNPTPREIERWEYLEKRSERYRKWHNEYHKKHQSKKWWEFWKK